MNINKMKTTGEPMITKCWRHKSYPLRLKSFKV